MPVERAARCLLVTGTTGFIGRWLTKRLLTEDTRLLLMGRSAPRWLSPEDADRVTFLHCDFAEPRSIDCHHEALGGVDGVAHLGGFVLRSPRPQDDDMGMSVRANLQATAHLVAPSAYVAVLPVLYEYAYVYGPPVRIPMDEDHLTRPTSYYGVSKLATEGLLRVYSERTGVPVTVLRLSQVYGPGDTSAKAIPNFIRAAVRGEPLAVDGDGSDVRDYVYVDDAVAAILSALARRVSGTFNIATGCGSSIREVLTTVLRLTEHRGVATWRPNGRTLTRWAAC